MVFLKVHRFEANAKQVTFGLENTLILKGNVMKDPESAYHFF